ncbi:GntR family transcriptional regulator [Nocardia tengchongensis]|uniref:GntR family transcriptional regulator n=1 Tax=Nocardia tengchongensis TaxID=2055889 RepID=UPI0036B0AD9A
MAEFTRPDPLWLQLVTHYRAAIKSGEIESGTRLPPVREIAATHGMSFNTVGRAMQALAAEGLVTTSNQGVTVSWSENGTFSPRDRLALLRRNPERRYPSGAVEVLGATLVPAPADVAAALGIETGAPVIRRERVHRTDGEPTQTSVSWMPGYLAESVPELLSTDPIPGGKGTAGAIKERMGLEVDPDQARLRESAQRADSYVAEVLGVAPGDPIIWGENIWPTAEGEVLEFGRYAIAEGRWITEGPEWREPAGGSPE